MQKKVIDVLGIDLRVYSNYKTKKDIPVKFVMKLADLYNVSADYILG